MAKGIVKGGLNDLIPSVLLDGFNAVSTTISEDPTVLSTSDIKAFCQSNSVNTFIVTVASNSRAIEQDDTTASLILKSTVSTTLVSTTCSSYERDTSTIIARGYAWASACLTIKCKFNSTFSNLTITVLSSADENQDYVDANVTTSVYTGGTMSVGATLVIEGTANRTINYTSISSNAFCSDIICFYEA